LEGVLARFGAKRCHFTIAANRDYDPLIFNQIWKQLFMIFAINFYERPSYFFCASVCRIRFRF